MHLNDPECRGVEVGDDYVFSIKTNLSDCGTIMVSAPFFCLQADDLLVGPSLQESNQSKAAREPRHPEQAVTKDGDMGFK